MIGTKIAHYEINEKLEEGGMGVVYRARETKLDREVAFKVLLEESAREPSRMERFEREAHVLASLNHPHIVSLYGLAESKCSRLLRHPVSDVTLSIRPEIPMARSSLLPPPGQSFPPPEETRLALLGTADLGTTLSRVIPA